MNNKYDVWLEHAYSGCIYYSEIITDNYFLPCLPIQAQKPDHLVLQKGGA